MGRPRIAGHRPKVKIGISLDADMYDWLSERTGAGREFASISHAIERAIAHYQRSAGEGEMAPGGMDR